MSNETAQPVSLEAKSPYELRTDMARGVSTSAIKEALDTGDMGFLHSFTTGSTVDGPGVRVVAWTAGCQWRCVFCHNPDTWSLTNGMPVPLEKAVEELRKYRHGLKTMGGGFTLTGGEPLMQDRFAVRLFAEAKKMGVHTALNSNGYLHARLSDAEMKAIDLFITDCKTWGDERHIALTGKEIGPTLEYMHRLAALKRPLWLRLVVIPGLTDAQEIVGHIAKFASSLGNIERVDVLPFHQLGRYKWKKLGIEYTLENTEPPANEVIQRVCAQFREEGLNAV